MEKNISTHTILKTDLSSRIISESILFTTSRPTAGTKRRSKRGWKIIGSGQKTLLTRAMRSERRSERRIVQLLCCDGRRELLRLRPNGWGACVMSDQPLGKSAIRKQLRERLQSMTDADRHFKSLSACTFITTSPEFAAARVVMLYLSTPEEVDTAPLALRAWQAG